MDFDSLTDDGQQQPSVAKIQPSQQQPLKFDDLESDTEKQDSIGQHLLTVGESAANTILPGAAPLAEAELGKALGTKEFSLESQRARAATHPISNIAGGILGFGSGLGVAGEISAAGKALGLGSGVVAQALKYGLEGLLASGSNEAAKAITSDPGQTAGNAAINIGLSGLIGAGLGGSTSGIRSLWLARNAPKVASALDSASEAINSADVNLPNAAGEFVGAPGAPGIKENAPDIAAALDRQNIKATPALYSSEPLALNTEGNLAERPTFAGVALNKERLAYQNKLSETAASTLDDATGQSQATVGASIKKDISKSLIENLEPIEEGYRGAEKEFKSIPVSDDMKISAIDPIANHDFVRLDPEAASVAKKVSNQIQGIENVSDLKKVRTLIGSQLNAEYGSGQGGGPKAQILQTAKTALSEMRSNALSEAASSGEISPDALENIKSLDAQYGAFQDTIKQLGVEGGLGRSNTARSLLSRFNNLSDESFTKKVFDTGDVRNMQFFKENFPDAFESARKFKLAEIQDAAIDHSQGANGKFSTAKFLNQVRKLDPEALKNVFNPEDWQKLKDIELLHEALPGKQNSSNTSYSMAFSNLLSPKGIVQNLTDTAQYAWLKSLPHLNEAAELAGGDTAAKLGAIHYAANVDKGTNPAAFKSMVDYIRATIKGESALSDGVKNLFDSSKAILPMHLVPDQDARDRLQKQLDLASNPQTALNPSPDAYSSYLPAHGTAHAQILGAATSYLAALKPTQPQMSPLDAKPPINKQAQAKYNRALDIAQQPLMALKYAKDGTLLPQDVHALRTIYPGLHDSIIKKITAGLIDNKGAHIPYNQRVGMNMLISGAPLDSTMTPMSAQAIMHSNASQQQPQAQGGSHKAGTGVALRQVNKVNDLFQTSSQARMAHRNK